MAQPKNSTKKVDENREFDTTQLKSTSHGYYVHRDYAAHFFRWGFLSRFINRQTSVLDVGCGQEMPVVRVLMASKSRLPKSYVGVDMNKIKKPVNGKWITVHDEFNFIKDHKKLIPEHGQFDVIVNYEVIEHMKKASGTRMIKAFHASLAEGGTLLLSTPCFNGKAAENHIHEYTIDELAKSLDKAGFVVEQRYGTFASANDIKKVLTKEERKIYDGIRKFYDNDVAACFLAPLYPDASRNNIWVCKRKEDV